LILTTTLRFELDWPPNFTKPVASSVPSALSPQRRDPLAQPPVVFSQPHTAGNSAAAQTGPASPRHHRQSMAISLLLNPEADSTLQSDGEGRHKRRELQQ
jgi:hypothetical protein